MEEMMNNVAFIVLKINLSKLSCHDAPHFIYKRIGRTWLLTTVVGMDCFPFDQYLLATESHHCFTLLVGAYYVVPILVKLFT
jgi:hypothetical protein